MRPLNPWCPLVCCLLLVVAGGCSKPHIVYDVDPAFRPASYGSVAQDPRKDRMVIREGMRPLNSELHLQAVFRELAARNYQTVAPSAADLWVSAYVLVGAAGGDRRDAAPASRKESSGGHRGGGRGGAGTGGAPSAGREGAAHGGFILIVQLEDPKTGLPVWQGEANLSFKDKGADGAPLSIDEAVRQLLQPLPARP